MITLEIYVVMLLIISAVSMYFIIGVLIKQIRLIKAPFELDSEYDDATKKVLIKFRQILFIISMTIVFTGLIPIVINIATLLFDLERPLIVQPIGFLYTVGVHVNGLLLSYLVSRLYRLASNEKEITSFVQHHIEDKLKKEKNK